MTWQQKNAIAPLRQRQIVRDGGSCCWHSCRHVERCSSGGVAPVLRMWHSLSRTVMTEWEDAMCVRCRDELDGASPTIHRSPPPREAMTRGEYGLCVVKSPRVMKITLHCVLNSAKRECTVLRFSFGAGYVMLSRFRRPVSVVPSGPPRPRERPVTRAPVHRVPSAVGARLI